MVALCKGKWEHFVIEGISTVKAPISHHKYGKRLAGRSWMRDDGFQWQTCAMVRDDSTLKASELLFGSISRSEIVHTL